MFRYFRMSMYHSFSSVWTTIRILEAAFKLRLTGKIFLETWQSRQRSTWKNRNISIIFGGEIISYNEERHPVSRTFKMFCEKTPLVRKTTLRLPGSNVYIKMKFTGISFVVYVVIVKLHHMWYNLSWFIISCSWWRTCVVAISRRVPSSHSSMFWEMVADIHLMDADP